MERGRAVSFKNYGGKNGQVGYVQSIVMGNSTARTMSVVIDRMPGQMMEPDDSVSK